MKIRMLIGTLLSWVVTLPVAAQVGDTTAYSPRVMPADASKRDTRYIGFYDACGESGGIRQPVVLAPVDGSPGLRLLEVRINASSDETFCFATPPPIPFHRTLFLVELPPDNNPTILAVDVKVRTADGVLISEGQVRIPPRFSDITPPSIAGTWNNPANAGQGVHISFSPVPIGDFQGFPASADGLVVVWATYAPDGEPLWLTGAGRLGRQSETNSGYVTTVELFSTDGGTFPGRAGPSATATAWGSVDIEYLRCGEIRFSWAARDSNAFPTGSMDLSQLTHTSASPCDLERFEYQRSRNVEIIVPQLVTAPADPS
jgi:hypothetical protein